MRKLFGKGRASGGFTLTELLVTIVMIALLGAAVGAGMTSCLTVYRQSVFVSQSELLGETLNTALADVLRYATEVRTGPGGVVESFNSSSYGISGGSLVLDGDGRIAFSRNAGGVELLLVNRGAYMSMELVSPLTLTYNSAEGIFTGSYTIAHSADPTLTHRVEFTFKTIA